MINSILWLAVFPFSLLVLIKASSSFTRAAEKIGISLGMPAFIVGVTIVSIGTSLPELISSILAVVNGSSEIVLGNVTGSNITNIFLVLGVVGITGKRIKINYELIHVDLPLFVGSAFLLTAMVWDSRFTIPEALLSILGFVLYILYTLNVERESDYSDENREKYNKLGPGIFLSLALSSILIYLGAKYTIESIVNLSEAWGIGTEIIAASAVALGTSLPEMMVSVTAAKQGKAELAIGNILGSNIFNAFAVTGISALFGPLIIPASILNFTLPMMLAATILYVFITQDKQITKWEGWLLILFYIFFIGSLLNLF